MKRLNLKKVSAIVMTTALLLQGNAAFASDLFSDGTGGDIFSAVPVEEVYVEPQPMEVVEEPVMEAAEVPVVEEVAMVDVVEIPVEEVIVEEIPVEETPVEEVIVEEIPVEETPVEEVIVEEIPVEEAPVVEVIVEEFLAEEAPAADEFIEMEVFEGYKTDFRFEDEAAIITANALEAAELPMNTEMVVVRLAEGTPEFEEAKAATEAAYGADESAEYVFYDVTFVVDGQKVEPAEGTVAINIIFKTLLVDEAAELQNVLHIDETENGQVVKDVTAYTEAGSNMQSVDFAF